MLHNWQSRWHAGIDVTLARNEMPTSKHRLGQMLSVLFCSQYFRSCQLAFLMTKTALVVLMSAKGKLVTRHCTNTVREREENIPDQSVVSDVQHMFFNREF